MSKIKESDIVFENDTAWVLDNKNSYEVMIIKETHSITDSAYSHDDDGLSIAIVRCKYLDKVKKN